MIRSCILLSALRWFGALLISLAAAMPAVANDTERYNQLEKQYNEYSAAGNSAEAERVGRELYELLRTRFPNEKALQVHWLNQVGIQCNQQGRYKDGEAMLKFALPIAERTQGTESTIKAHILYNLGMNYKDSGRGKEAAEMFLAAYKIYNKNDGLNHAHTSNALLQLGDVWHNAGQYADAREALQLCLQARTAIYNEDDPLIAQAHFYLGRLEYADGKYAAAQAAYYQAMVIYEKAREEGHWDVLNSAARLAEALRKQEKYQEAEKLYSAMREVIERRHGQENAYWAMTMCDLGELYNIAGRYQDAQEALQPALAAYRVSRGDVHHDVAHTLIELAYAYEYDHQHKLALDAYQQAMEVYEQLSGAESADCEYVWGYMSRVYRSAGNFQEAERTAQKAVEIADNVYPADSPQLETSLRNLAQAYYRQSRYAEALPILQKLLNIMEKSYGPSAWQLSATCHDLGSVYHGLSRYIEAEQLYLRAIKIRQEAYGADSSFVAHTKMFLGSLQRAMGRYLDAEEALHDSVAIYEKVFGTDHPNTAIALYELAETYDAEGNAEAAERHHRRALAIRENVLGPEHPESGTSLLRIAEFASRGGRDDEALAIYEKALAVLEKSLGPEHPDLSFCLSSLGSFHSGRGRYDQAKQYFDRALAIREKHFGRDHVETVHVLYDVALMNYWQGNYKDAERLVDQVITVRDRNNVSPKKRFYAYELRAATLWALGHKADAVDDLKQAMDLAEQQRGNVAGDDQDRARLFGQMSFVFERMVKWQAEQGDVAEAFLAMERSRAQSLKEELLIASNVDLEAGSTLLARQQIEQQEAEIKVRLASIEQQLKELAQSPDGSEKAQAEQENLLAELSGAREELYQLYRQRRQSNTAYRTAVTRAVQTSPVGLRQIQRQLVGIDGVLLSYLVGVEGSYLITVTADDSRLLPLVVSDAAADGLGIEAGPLTAMRLRQVLVGADDDGLLQKLADPQGALAITAQLAALWEVLVPEEVRPLIDGGSTRRLLIVPDGPLSLVPFEALVVESGRRPRYLLDVGPAIVYGPSANTLHELDRKPMARPAANREPVLTLGDPEYGTEGNAYVVARPDGNAVTTRFGAIGSPLAALPYSGQESKWVVDVFEKYGLKAAQLIGPEATERRLRESITGRSIIHLACHGLTDQQYGNLFGTLALTPGPEMLPDDDGYLTLAEIYELDLKSCELAVLSACETNYGPQQKGEGVWALSRGFLVAGAKRVVASNWVVDDEAAASLVSYLCGGIAETNQKDGADNVQYAAALHTAKRHVRNNRKWESPYYWAPFVMVGPN